MLEQPARGFCDTRLQLLALRHGFNAINILAKDVGGMSAGGGGVEGFLEGLGSGHHRHGVHHVQGTFVRQREASRGLCSQPVLFPRRKDARTCLWSLSRQMWILRLMNGQSCT